ncbi:hypothetical protein BJQ89_03102 [Arthrobacter sp. ES1]|nr:hypothetical protein [Arthrobacter sp. ES1]
MDLKSRLDRPGWNSLDVPVRAGFVEYTVRPGSGSENVYNRTQAENGVGAAPPCESS